MEAHFLIFPDCWAEFLLDITDTVLWVSGQNVMPCYISNLYKRAGLSVKC